MSAPALATWNVAHISTILLTQLDPCTQFGYQQSSHNSFVAHFRPIEVCNTLSPIDSLLNPRVSPAPTKHLRSGQNFPRPFAAPPHLAHGVDQLDVDKSANIRVKTTIDGTVDSLDPANLEFLTGEHICNLCADLKAAASTRIIFGRPFLTSSKATATGIHTNGFTLNIEMWGDTILYAAQACWIAYPEDRAHIFSASVDTQEVW
ncbi:hypothetical protein BS17DRAFT_815386 [Gyrodon lividus]|nr:hypothetical protein BS17DRAFT_815386 [Gyrodon lividus]